MGGFRIEGDTGDIAEVTSGAVEVNTPRTAANAGFAATVVEIDSGSVTGTRVMRSPFVTQYRRQTVGLDTMLFYDNFNSVAHNTAIWKYIFATMTSTMGSGSLLMNSGSTLNTASGCQLTTWRTFPLYGGCTTRYEIRLSFTSPPLANQMVEFGLFPHGTGVAAPTEGIFFRYTNAGLVGVASYNGNEGTPVTLVSGSLSTDVVYTMVFSASQDQILWYVDGVCRGTISVPNAQGFPTMQPSLPVSQQFRNSGLVSGAPVMQAKIAAVNVYAQDMNSEKPWNHQLAMQGLGYQGLNGGTMGSLSNYTNSLAPTAGAALTNTTAALGTGLGGQFSGLPTLAANTDGVVCSYQNPAGGINQTPRLLVITGVRIQGIITTILAGGPLYYAYALCFGHTTVSLATAETASFATATTKASRRIPMGFETYAANAAVGTLGQGVTLQLQNPIVVNPGEFVAVSAKNMGTVTTTGVITWLVSFDHYFE